jgi:uncharacterized membrane protein YdjX (TVP38/TMEM64 family)
LLQQTTSLIREHPVLGAALFVVVSALSAMLMFFSGAVLVPVGIESWGEIGCLLLLWAGWLLGGLVSYGIGRQFGRPLIAHLITEQDLRSYEARMMRNTGFVPAFLLQLAFPSDVMGYVFGLVHFPFKVYVAALLCAELPYAVGTVFLGAAVMQQHWIALAAGVCGAAVVIAWQWRMRRIKS